VGLSSKRDKKRNVGNYNEDFIRQRIKGMLVTCKNEIGVKEFSFPFCFVGWCGRMQMK
jgi:hypothetical protein